MGNSDSSDDRFNLEEIIDRIGRRELLGIGAVLLGGLILTDQSDGDDQLKRAEDQLVTLAASIDDADLVDPQQSSSLHEEVAEAVESVNDALNQRSSDDQETERISALSAAAEYYEQLEETLDVATSLRTRVTDSEVAVLYHEGEIRTNLATNFDTDSFKKSIARLSKAEIEPAAVKSGDRRLVPNQQMVVDSLRGQHDVYELHINAQQTYLDTATTIEAGIRAQERLKLDVARPQLAQARDSLVDGIPTTKDHYRLSHVGLSLDQYATLLTLRRKGVKKLLDVCDSSTPAQQRRSASNEAIDLFFEARGVVTNS